ncbi:MAG: hypothetical protein HYY23_11180 [Verrucomicrobia bacterium]|nr:hypothetical protein [Verrucomicrobiota bacterium]
MKKASLNSCNVLEAGPQGRSLWQFNVNNGQVKLNTHESITRPARLPAKLVAKDWRSLWKRKLNIAWVPAEHVFVRVVHLPAADFAELVSMVELQLEKLSPLPVNQIVWSLELGPRYGENLQTVIVIIATRSAVEEFLGNLEEDGFLTDRLELPCLYHLLAAGAEEDAVWIRPMTDGGRRLCLVAWWCRGGLQQLQLLRLPESSNPGLILVEELTKTAWAGEMEGWLNSRLRCHLVNETDFAANLEPALREWSGAPVALVDSVARPALAELCARRAAHAETKANLLPVEFGARYHQQFVDRLWMTGLGAVLAAYLVGVLVYFGALQTLRFKKYQIEKQVAALSGSYTNAVKLKARAEVLQDQLNLKFAALDCLKAASERLLGGLTLTLFSFSKGQALYLEGTAEKDDETKIIDYNEALRKETVNGDLLFRSVEQPNWSARGQTIIWRFNCALNRSEIE